jgi:hypothetical protein
MKQMAASLDMTLPRRTSADQPSGPIAAPPDYDQSLREFTGGIWTLSEQGQGKDIADLVERLLNAMEQKGADRADQRSRNRGLHNYLNTAIAVLTLATVVFWGGTAIQELHQDSALLQQHDAAIRQMQQQIDTAVQVSSQVNDIKSQVSRLSDRIDRFLDKGR